MLEGDALSRRALWLETPLGSVVLGEARVGFAGSPCVANGTITFEVLGDTRLAYSFTGDVPAFAEWFLPLCEDVSALVEEATRSYERLTRLQHALIDLIDFLDDPPARFRVEFRSKL